MPDMSGRLILMSGRELRPCRTFCPAGFNSHKMSDKKNKNDPRHLPAINWEKSLTGAQNVRQSSAGLSDIFFFFSKIIFVITDYNSTTLTTSDYTILPYMTCINYPHSVLIDLA